MRAFGALLLTACVLAAASCTRAPATDATAEADAASRARPAGRPLRVAVLLAIGRRGDDGFNRGATEGAERAAQEGGVELRVLDAVPDAQRELVVDRLADSSDLVIGVGFLLSDPLTRAA